MHEHHFLCKPVGSIGLLRKAAPKVTLPEWHTGVFRVGANSPDAYKFFHFVTLCLFNKVGAHPEIVSEKTNGLTAIDSDAAHHRREIDHDFWLDFLKESSRLCFIAQVVVA